MYFPRKLTESGLFTPPNSTMKLPINLPADSWSWVLKRVIRSSLSPTTAPSGISWIWEWHWPVWCMSRLFTSMNAEEYGYILEHSDAKMVIVSDKKLLT